MEILQIDQNVLVWLNKTLLGQAPWLDAVVKFCGVYLIYALPVVLILLWFTNRKEQFALGGALLAALFSWFVITKEIASHLWYRARPEIAVTGLKEVFFHRPDYSFPSDHATALFAIVFALYFLGYKKAANWFLVYALIILVARVAVGVHYPLDILGGVTSGLIGAGLIYILRHPIKKYLFEPVIQVVRKIRLA